jgi:anti-sigma28 factor (negative regulator of flagellin synthesis)
MRVYGDQLAGWTAEQAARTAEVQSDAGAQAKGSGSATKDRVELSGLASQIAQAHAEYATGQSARVGELSQIYANGRYEVNARQLSHSMVNQWLVGAGTALKTEP